MSKPTDTNEPVFITTGTITEYSPDSMKTEIENWPYYQSMPAPDNNPWISVDDRLPDDAFESLLSVLMEADPWAFTVDREPIETLLDNESRARGYDDWIDALHRYKAPVPGSE